MVRQQHRRPSGQAQPGSTRQRSGVRSGKFGCRRRIRRRTEPALARHRHDAQERCPSESRRAGARGSSAARFNCGEPPCAGAGRDPAGVAHFTGPAGGTTVTSNDNSGRSARPKISRRDKSSRRNSSRRARTGRCNNSRPGRLRASEERRSSSQTCGCHGSHHPFRLRRARWCSSPVLRRRCHRVNLTAALWRSRNSAKRVPAARRSHRSSRHARRMARRPGNSVARGGMWQ